MTHVTELMPGGLDKRSLCVVLCWKRQRLSGKYGSISPIIHELKNPSPPKRTCVLPKHIVRISGEAHIYTHHLQITPLFRRQHHHIRPLYLRMGSLGLVMRLVQCIDIRFRRSDDNVRVSALSINNSPVVIQSDRHLTLRIGTGGNIIHRVEF